ncbi:hypothetical protein HPB50_007458 [Hyalomma asiaticum]|uniref:Uncharacterized protein n=1 Tax=Hyalomma asiaticum TaxID=266040 RepID=A0ACB7SM08_HYAAI|nr:hypothetical protein HPB50_007458 [Hyalomma asiaticum]
MDDNAAMPEAKGKLPVSHGDQGFDLESVTGCFTGVAVDYGRPCPGMPDRPCHIVRELPAWNELLFPARMQLQEMLGAPGKLSLVSITETVMGLPEPHDLHFRQGAVVMHRLLRHHQCVAFLYVSPLYMETFSPLLCDALPHSSLKRLKVRCSGLQTPEFMCATLPSLTSLEKLECLFCNEIVNLYGGNFPTDFPNAVADLVRTSSSLVALVLNGVSMVHEASENLLAALTECGTLKELTLGSMVFPCSCREDLLRYLALTPSLESFVSWGDNGVVEKGILEGILHNRTISQVSIVNFTGDSNNIKLVARIFSEKTFIRSLCIFSVSVLHSPRDTVPYESWIEALRQNETLEELTLPCDVWQPQQWIRFNAMLPLKHSLKKVFISSDHEDSYLMSTVCRALGDSYVHDKVSCGVYVVEDSIDLLKCEMFSGLLLWRLPHEDMKLAALRQLPDCTHVTSLEMDIRRGDLAVSLALAEYVRSTSVLLKLTLDTTFSDEFESTDTWWRVIMESLSKNNSINELEVYAENLGDMDVETLADTVKGRTNIRKLLFGDSSMSTMCAFINRLAVGIVDNHTLLSVVFDGQLDQEALDTTEKVFAICETARRNSGLLVGAAAAFSKTTHLDRYSTGALERLYKNHAVLLEDLAEHADVSAAEIRNLARRHLNRTASLDDYMRITGVVKERVVCRPRDDGRMQLDDLHEDCWALVRRYLLLDDVEEAVVLPEMLPAVP